MKKERTLIMFAERVVVLALWATLPGGICNPTLTCY